jgi:hypothetical protein
MEPYCVGPFCFDPPVGEFQRVFGFAEFISALALFVVVYTVTDTRFKLRISLAPRWLYASTFWAITALGLSTLVTDVWVAQRWWLVRSRIGGVAVWQGLLGSVFLGLFLLWMYYAFIKPRRFSRSNAENYFDVMMGYISTGNDEQLLAVARELYDSIDSIVAACPTTDAIRDDRTLPDRFPDKIAAESAWNLLLLMANPRFCRSVVESVPYLAFALLHSARTRKKYRIPMGAFVRGVATEAINNKSSLLHQEGRQFPADFVSQAGLWSHELYGDFELIEHLERGHNSPLNIDYRVRDNWDDEHWKAYCRTVLLTMDAMFRAGRTSDAYVIYRALADLESCLAQIRQLSEIEKNYYEHPADKKLVTVVSFVNNAIELLEKHSVAPWAPLRRAQHAHTDIYDQLADLVFETCVSVSRIEGSPDKLWGIQSLTVWHRLFGVHDPSKQRRILLRKVRRLLFDETKTMETFAHFKNVPLLGFLLNVVGIQRHKTRSQDSCLVKPITNLARRSFLKIRRDSPEVAASLVKGYVGFDRKSKRIYRTYAKPLSGPPPRVYLDLDPI